MSLSLIFIKLLPEKASKGFEQNFLTVCNYQQVLKENLLAGPISISVFEKFVYWSSNLTRDIEYCNKFNGKDWKTLYRANDLPRNFHISHSAAKPKVGGILAFLFYYKNHRSTSNFRLKIHVSKIRVPSCVC